MALQSKEGEKIDIKTEPFEDRWGEQWLYVESEDRFVRQSDKFAIRDLNNYDHWFHSKEQVRMDRWCSHERMECRGWDVYE
jgi:hypothetical protein